MQADRQNLKSALVSDELLGSFRGALARDEKKSYISGYYVLEALCGIDPGGILVVREGDVARCSKAVADDTGYRRLVLKNGCNHLIGDAGGRSITLVPLGTGGIEDYLRSSGLSPLAMAVELTDHIDVELLDPVGGLSDVGAGRLRATHSDSFLVEPLRVLVAARLRGKYGLEADESARVLMRKAAPAFSSCDMGRAWRMIASLLGGEGLSSSASFLKETGALGSLFPELEAIYDVPQNYYHHLGVWEHTLLLLDYLEDFFDKPGVYFRSLGKRVYAHLQAEVESGMNRRCFLGMGALLHDIGKARCMRIEPSGRIRFKGHQVEGGRMAKDIARRMRLGRRGSRQLVGLIRDHMRLGFLIEEGESAYSRLRVARELGEMTPQVALLSFTDRMATRGEASSEESMSRFKRTVSRVLSDYFWDRYAPRLVSGSDVVIHGQAESGPGVKRELERARAAQREGLIQDRRQALEYLAPDFKGRMEG